MIPLTKGLRTSANHSQIQFNIDQAAATAARIIVAPACRPITIICHCGVNYVMHLKIAIWNILF